MYRGRNNIIAGLPQVHMVIGMYGLVPTASTKQFHRAIGDYLIGIHVGRGTGAGLENVHYELSVPFAFDDLLSGLLDCLRNPPRQKTQTFVSSRGMLLDHPQCPNENSGKAK